MTPMDILLIILLIGATAGFIFFRSRQKKQIEALKDLTIQKALEDIPRANENSTEPNS